MDEMEQQDQELEETWILQLVFKKNEPFSIEGPRKKIFKFYDIMKRVLDNNLFLVELPDEKNGSITLKSEDISYFYLEPKNDA